jgi:hypothetical protein
MLYSAAVTQGVDDDLSRTYSVERASPPAFAAGSSSSGVITLTPDPVVARTSVAAPTITFGAPPSTAST